MAANLDSSYTPKEVESVPVDPNSASKLHIPQQNVEYPLCRPADLSICLSIKAQSDHNQLAPSLRSVIGSVSDSLDVNIFGVM